MNTERRHPRYGKHIRREHTFSPQMRRDCSISVQRTRRGILRLIPSRRYTLARKGIPMFRKLHCRPVRREVIQDIPVRCAAAVIRAMRHRRSDTAIRHLRRRLPARAADIRDISAPAAETVIRVIKPLLRDIAFPQVLPIRLVQAQAIRHTPARSADITTRATKRSRSDTVTQRQRKIRPVRKMGTRPINVRAAA